MFKGKNVKVILVGDAKDEYERLNKIVGDELKKGVENSDNQTLLNSIKRVLELLKDNPQYGFHIKKKQIPKEYIKEYEVNNLWKCNLAGYWRLIYTIKTEELEIIDVVLDIIDHKTYDEKFGYK